MQTIKTAAIVVLLMTVMYGAYVSLTTPPEPLPEDVQDLVIHEEGTLAMDASLPASLGTLEINTGTLSSADETVGSLDMGDLSRDVEASIADVPAVSADAVTTTFSDSPSVPEPAFPSNELSVPDTQGRNYPTTTSVFELPDPDAIASEFETGPGNAIPDLALTSGTSESQPYDIPSATDLAPSLETSPPPRDSQISNTGLANAMRTADEQFAADRRAEALATLSLFYNSPNMSGEERSELLVRLDPLAREVIYSTRHLLEQPYRVGQSETLMEVAARYEVPWQLLANINQITDPVTVLPGTELKVVRGPFRAEVSLSSRELTLFLGDLYAGRFPIGIGNDPAPKPGSFTVQDKQTGRTFYDAAGSPVPAGSPENPYGDIWLDLGGQLCIHGSPSTTSPSSKGCISLAADFADDLYGILSPGSSVTIRR